MVFMIEYTPKLDKGECMILGIPSGAEMIHRSKETLGRFPLALVSSLLVALLSVYLIEVEPKKMEGTYLALSKMALTGSLMVFVFTAVRLLGEQLSKKWQLLWVMLALAGATGYYLMLPDSARDFDAGIIAFRHFFLSLLFAVAFLWAPFVKVNPENSDYWEYAKLILFSWTMAFFFTIVAVLGINGALFAIEKLFDMPISGKRYFQADILIVAIFSVGYFLSQIPKNPLETRFAKPIPKVERFFTKWLLTSLSLLYFVILYAYSVKLLVTGEWPKGILAWLIVIFSTVAILTYLFWTHFVRREGGGWRRWIWLAVLLQTVMLFVAIGMRIAEYSWTESRYMVFVLGVWLAGLSLYFLLFRRSRIKWIFVSLSLLIAITQFGPLSAYAVSRYAQERRLSHMLTELKHYEPASKAPAKLRYEISDAISYLAKRYRRESLERIFPEIIKAFKRKKRERERCQKEKRPLSKASSEAPAFLPEYITYRLGFNYINRWEYQQMKHAKSNYADFSVPRSSRKSLWHVSGYDYVVDVNTYAYEMTDRRNKKKRKKWEFPAQNIVLEYGEDFRFIVAKNDTNVSFDLGGHMKKMVKKYGNSAESVQPDELILQRGVGNIRVKLELDHLGKREREGNEVIEFGGRLYLGGLR